MNTSRRSLLKFMGAVPLAAVPVEVAARAPDEKKSYRIHHLIPGSRVFIEEQATNNQIFLGDVPDGGVVDIYPPKASQLLVRVRLAGYEPLRWEVYYDPEFGLNSYIVQHEDSL